MELVGLTVLAPLVLTEPILVIDTEVALEVDHDKDELPPEVIFEGVAVSEHVGAGVGAVTVTLAEQVTEPPAPVKVPT